MDEKKLMIHADYMKLDHELEVAENKIIYKDNMRAYNEYLNFVSYLVKVLSYPRNALSAVVAINTLIRKGVFSRDGIFQYRSPMTDNVEGCLGINIINGYGNSRNISAFINDVLVKLGYTSYVMYANVSANSHLQYGNLGANQALNLIEQDGALYGYDAVNNSFYKFIAKDKMQEIYTKNSPFYAYYSPYIDMVYSEMNAENVKSFMAVCEASVGNKIMDEDRFKFMVDYTTRQIDRSNVMLEDTVRYTKQYVDRITKGITVSQTKGLK